MKIFFLTGMVIAGFAGSMTASNMVTQEDQDGTTSTTQGLRVNSGQTQAVAAPQSRFNPVAELVTQEAVAAAEAYEGALRGRVITVNGQQQNSPEAGTRRALNALKNAKDDEARAEAEKNLREALQDEYDAMLELHEEQLDKLEAKIEELRGQISKRRSAKSEMVDLYFKMMLHEADGLGWPGRHSQHGLNSSFNGVGGTLNWANPPIAFPSELPGILQRSGSGGGVGGVRSGDGGGGAPRAKRPSGGGVRASDGGTK
jgi:hypothetical protein